MTDMLIDGTITKEMYDEKLVEKEDILDEFDRTIFESIIEKVYVDRGFEETTAV